jgi:hypothetical protein
MGPLIANVVFYWTEQISLSGCSILSSSFTRVASSLPPSRTVFETEGRDQSVGLEKKALIHWVAA